MPRRLGPLEASELVDVSFALYRQNFGLFTAIAAVVYVPYAIVSSFADRAGSDATGLAHDLTLPGTHASATFASVLLTAFCVIVVQAALSVAVTDKYLGLQTSFAAAYRAVLQRGLHLLAVFALSMGAVVAGACACALPALALAVGLSFAPQIVVLEKISAPRALTRAWHLSRGDRFRIFGVMLLSSIATLSIWLTAFLFANWAFRSELTVQLFTEVFGLLALPVVHVTLVVVYFDNRVRKEGFDLALSAARLATGMPESVASSAPATL